MVQLKEKATKMALGLLLFQYLMVQLKVFADNSLDAQNFISIPHGTIKS